MEIEVEVGSRSGKPLLLDGRGERLAAAASSLASERSSSGGADASAGSIGPWQLLSPGLDFLSHLAR
jgi:hypothetical protein